MTINAIIFVYKITVPYIYDNVIDGNSLVYLIFLLLHMFLMYKWKPTNQINKLFFPLELIIEILLLTQFLDNIIQILPF